MANKNSKLYISDQTETSEQDAKQGDTQVLIAGKKNKMKKLLAKKMK